VRTEIREVPVRQLVPVPEELVLPCKVPDLPTDNPLTYGDIVEALVGALGTVEKCNGKLDKISKLRVRSNLDVEKIK
jgi:hypothetical protein